MNHIKTYNQLNIIKESLLVDDNLKDMIRVEFEDSYHIEDVTFVLLLKNVYTTTLTMDITWDRQNVEDYNEFDNFRVNLMESIQSKLSKLGKKLEFRISLPPRGEWHKSWVFDYNSHTHTLKVSFYLIVK